MESPSKQAPGERTYELPQCTICMQELAQDLSSLDCGHVYHLPCISQHFEYRGTCPNCQKRASLKEARTIHLRFTPHNHRLQLHINSLLSALPAAEKNQVDALMAELKASAADKEKLQQQVASLESDIKSKAKMVDALREEVYRHKLEGDKMIRENRKLAENYNQTKQQLEKQEKMGKRLRQDNERLRREEREFQQMKRFKAMLQQNSQEIVRYKEELEANFTPSDAMAKAFYEMLLMKNLEILRAKDKIKEMLDRQTEKDAEINRLRSTVEGLKREAKETGEKRTNERRRFEEMKQKYRMLSEKAKQKGVKDADIQMLDENSQTFSNRSVHIPDDPVIQSTIRKPFFTPGHATIGGFTARKKDDRLGGF